MLPALRQLKEQFLHEPLSRLLNVDDKHRSDLINPVCMVLLMGIGVVFIWSAQSATPEINDWMKQLLWIFLGLGAYAVVSLINYKFWLQNAHLVFLAAMLLLVPLAMESAGGLDLPLVQSRFGSTRWIDFGPFSLQPSETAKIGTLVFAASLLARAEIGTLGESLSVLVKTAVTFSIPILLIFLQPDLGSSLVFPPMAFSLLFVSRLPIRFFTTVFALFLLAVALVAVDVYRYQDHYRSNDLSFTADRGAYEPHRLLPIKDYQRERILTFVAPEVVDPSGIGSSWNLIQSLIAVAGGGLSGKGIGQGTQAILGYLPPTIAPNDFIFSVAAEESGFLGGAFIITLFAVLIANGFRVANMARDRFGMLLATGVSVIFIVHVFVNIGMTLGMMPITGLPLPFLSYGGSFMISCCILQGLIQSVHRYRRDFS